MPFITWDEILGFATLTSFLHVSHVISIPHNGWFLHIRLVLEVDWVPIDLMPYLGLDDRGVTG